LQVLRVALLLEASFLYSVKFEESPSLFKSIEDIWVVLEYFIFLSVEIKGRILDRFQFWWLGSWSWVYIMVTGSRLIGGWVKREIVN
jgi:hypothetical protein